MKLRLRNAEEGDCKFLFDLRNQPIVREASFNTDEIAFDQHAAWYKTALRNPDTVILVGVEDSLGRIGMVRFNKRDDLARISVAVSPTLQSKGYGTSLIRDGCYLYMSHEKKVNEIIAEIKETNIASMQAFAKAGFVETKTDSDNSEMRLFRSLENYSIGVKIFTTNHEAFRKLREFHDKRIIDFVELYVVPGVVDTESLDNLKGIPIILHAPNYNHDFNLRDENQVYEESMKTLETVSEYLHEKTVIFHPGLESGKDDIKYVIAKINELKTEFDIILENMPRRPIRGKRNIIGAHIDDFNMIVENTGCKVCIDIGHTICSANYFQRDALQYLQTFFNLHPYMFHIGDGEYSSQSDVHKPLLEGDFPLHEIITMIPLNSRITLETPKSDFTLLSEDLDNLQKLKNLIRGISSKQ
ncbi:MAG: GNAT family N-acetyltransferase [Candidatus Thorarchaeota archaeon]